jgi:hypothetical protein
MIKNWMTTIPGVLTLVGVLFNAWQTKTIDWPSLQAALRARRVAIGPRPVGSHAGGIRCAARGAGRGRAAVP